MKSVKRLTMMTLFLNLFLLCAALSSQGIDAQAESPSSISSEQAIETAPVIIDAFNEYGIQIMTPAYEGDPDQPKVVPKEQWFAAPAKPPEG